MSDAQTTNLTELRERAATPQAIQHIEPGFHSAAGFELMQRQAKMYAASSLVPPAYQAVLEKTDYKGNIISSTPNPKALANCMIALNISTRMKADALSVMQNLYIVEGRPSWSSQWIIAQINACGRFSPLRFDIKDLGEKECSYTTYSWDDATRSKVPKTQKVQVHDYRCIAWAVERGTEIPKFDLESLRKYKGLYGCCKEFGIPIIESPPVSVGMAVAEGWYTKNGSKWQTMAETMMSYRAASFLGKIYAPELLMGMNSIEESEDIAATAMQQGSDGTYSPVEKAAKPAPESSTIDELRAAKTSQATDVQPKEKVIADPETGEVEPQKATRRSPPATEENLFGSTD